MKPNITASLFHMPVCIAVDIKESILSHPEIDSFSLKILQPCRHKFIANVKDIYLSYTSSVYGHGICWTCTLVLIFRPPSLWSMYYIGSLCFHVYIQYIMFIIL